MTNFLLYGWKLVCQVIFIEQWERALASGKEVIVLGDCNLDHQKFNNSGAEQPLLDIMVEKIYPH